MRIIKKQSKKELELRIFELEKDIEKLKSKQTADKSITFASQAKMELISLFLNSANIDILSYTPSSDSFDNLNELNSLCLLNKTPVNLTNLLEQLQGEDTSLVSAFIVKPGDKKYISLQLKYSAEKEAGLKENKTIRLTVIPQRKESESFIFAFTDVSSEAKQRKELLRSKEKLEESDKLKSIILANISHHIRTPLNSVTGFSELLTENDFNSIKRKEYIDIIKRQSKIILALIDDLSEISKFESGNFNISKTACSLNLILNELLGGINQQRANQRKELVSIDSCLPKESIELLTDPGRLVQALTHLLNYSLRYTNKGKIELGYCYKEDIQKIEFYIEDSSDGLSKEEQKVIFNKFTSIENPESTRLDDPGLGLTIARSIIKALGGRIWVESLEGKGTKFIFNIPFEPVPIIEEADIVAQEAPKSSLYDWPNKVILIVDDEEVNAMFLDAVFFGTNVQVIFAKNGQDAINLCKSISKIDLILMDLKMPVLDGLKATAEIRTFNTAIPIIAQTALASQEDKHNSKVAGCNATITKPIEVEELLELVNRYLSD